MYRYAIEIQPEDLNFIALLNGGVEPQIESKTTYLVITIEDSEHSHNDIVTEEELVSWDAFAFRPTIYRLK